MSHRHTVIEPADGLTVLVGPNNCGKSAVITALQILAHNENSTYVSRHGEKVCSVTVHTDDGHEIVWQRKNNSTSYCIDGKLFDRLRSGVPDELKQTLRLPKVDLNTSNEQIDIHFGMQKQPVFLLNESGRTAAGFFAASSDASRLIEMQKVHKEKVRSKKQDAKRLESEVQVLQDEVDRLETVQALAAQMNRCEQIKLQWVASDQLAHRLKAIVSKAVVLNAELSRCQQRAQQYDLLPLLPQLAPAEDLSERLQKIVFLNQRENQLNRFQQLVQPLELPPILDDVERLRDQLDRLHQQKRRMALAETASKALDALTAEPEVHDLKSAQRLLAESHSLKQRMNGLANTEHTLDKQLQHVEAQINALIDAQSTCPTCLQPLTAETVVEHLKTAGDCREE